MRECHGSSRPCVSGHGQLPLRSPCARCPARPRSAKLCPRSRRRRGPAAVAAAAAALQAELLFVLAGGLREGGHRGGAPAVHDVIRLEGDAGVAVVAQLGHRTGNARGLEQRQVDLLV